MSWLTRSSPPQEQNELQRSLTILQQTLDGLPDVRQRRMVAIRTALRTVQRAKGITIGPWSWGHEDGEALILHAVRLLFVHWVAQTYGGVEERSLASAWEALRRPLIDFDRDMPDFFARNIMGSDYACASWEEETERGRRTIALVEAVATLRYEVQPFDASRHYANPLHTARFSFEGSAFNAAAWPAEQLHAHQVDAAAVKRLPPQAFMLLPLWPTAEGAALATYALPYDIRLEHDGHGPGKTSVGHHVAMWLRERKAGALVMANPPEAMRERMVRAANLPDEFWTSRKPAETYGRFDYLFTGALDNPHWGEV